MPATSPHDLLIKAVFTRAEHAAGELVHVLPASVTAPIDMGRLALVAAGGIDAGRDRGTDLLFSAPAARRPLPAEHHLLLHLRFEQHRPDASVLARRWRCLGAIWQQQTGLEPGEHPSSILSVVIHHGAAPCGLAPGAEIVDRASVPSRATGQHAPVLGLYLDDLAAQDDAALRARPMPLLPRLALWALKNAAHERDLVARLQPWADDLRHLASTPAGVLELSMVLRYLLDVSHIDPDALEAFLGDVGHGAREAYMTAADILRARARDQGRAQGRIEGRIEGCVTGRVEERRATVQRVLELRFGALPEDARVRIGTGDGEALLRLLDRAVTAPSLADALGALPAGHE